MIEDEDRGLGRCVCGKWAIVGLGNARLCEQHMNEAFKRVGDITKKLS